MTVYNINTTSTMPVLKEGDEIVFAAGTYYNRFIPTVGSIKIKGIGDVWFDGKNANWGHAQGMVQINKGINNVVIDNIGIKNTGGVLNQAGCAGLSVYGDNCVVTNLKTNHTGASGAFVKDCRNFKLSKFNIVDACYMGAQEGITLHNVDGFEVFDGTLSGFQYVYVDAGAKHPKEGVDAKCGSSNGTIHDILVDGARNGVYVDGYSSTARNVEIWNINARNIEEVSYPINAERGGGLENIHFHHCISNGCKYYAMKVSHSPALVRNCTFEHIKIENNGSYGMQIVAPAGVVENLIVRNIDWGTLAENRKMSISNVSSQYHVDTTQHTWEGFINQEEPVVVLGCTDPTALNYNQEATKDDGSCGYAPVPVLGCTDSMATNYNPDATQDDGSCVYEGNSELEAKVNYLITKVDSIDTSMSIFNDRLIAISTFFSDLSAESKLKIEQVETYFKNKMKSIHDILGEN